MVSPAVPIAIGAGGLIGGSLLRDDATDRREDALNRVMRGRERTAGNLNARREALLSMALGRLPEFAGRRQGMLSQAVAGLGQRGQAMDQATDEGRQRILSSLEGMDLGSAAPAPVGGVGTGGGAQEALAAEGRPLTQALQGLSASGLGQMAGQRQTGDIMRQLQLGQTELGADVGQMTGDLALSQSRIGLMDLLNQLYTQERLGSASQVGGRSDAVGGLLQNVGGSFLGAGLGGVFG